jgi:hypothetical protein
VFSDSLVNLIKRSCIMLNRLRGCARLSLYTFDARYACDEHGDEVRDATRVSDLQEMRSKVSLESLVSLERTETMS